MEELTIQEITCLEHVKKRIEESENKLLQNALENGELPDEYILQFIRNRSYNVESSYQRLKKLHEARILHYPEAFATLSPQNPKMLYGIEQRIIRRMKHRDPSGRCVFTMRYFDPQQLNGDEFFQFLTLLGTQSLQDKLVQEKGFMNIFDLSSFSFAHYKCFNPRVILRWSKIMLSASPVKLRAMHFTNVHPIFRATLATIKMLIPKKMADRIYVYGKPEKGMLDNFMPAAHLPEWLGGDLTEDEATDWNIYDELLTPECEEYFMKIAQPSITALKKC